MNNPFLDLNQKFLDPLLKATGFKKEDQTALRNTWNNIIMAEVLIKAAQALPENEAKNLEEKIKQCPTDQEKTEVLKQAFETSPLVNQAITQYFKTDFSQLLDQLIDSFTQYATPEQKAKLHELLLQQNPQLTSKSKT